MGQKNKIKLSYGGSVLASEVCAGSNFGRGCLIRLGYTKIEVVRGAMRSEGGLDWAKKLKPSCRGLVLASEVWVCLFLDRGDPIMAGYAGIEVKGRHNQVRGLVWEYFTLPHTFSQTP